MTLNGISFSVIFCLFCLFLCFLFLIFVLLEIWSVGRLTIWLRAFSLATYLPYRELNPSTLKIILNIHVNFLYTTHFKQIPSSLECCSNKHQISLTTNKYHFSLTAPSGRARACAVESEPDGGSFAGSSRHEAERSTRSPSHVAHLVVYTSS